MYVYIYISSGRARKGLALLDEHVPNEHIQFQEDNMPAERNSEFSNYYHHKMRSRQIK